MTRARTPGRWAWGMAGALALVAGAPSAMAGRQPLDLYYERSLMLAADTRCRLFSSDLAAALAAAQAQARGAALRGGAGQAALAGALGRAEARARQTACGSADLAVAADRVRQAFGGYSRLQRMTFEGEAAHWNAHRVVSPDAPSWRLSQTLAFGPDRAVFGLAGQGASQQLMATASFADGTWPYAARLVLRDPAQTPLPQPHRLQAGSVRAPPRAGARVVLAEGRSLAETRLLPPGARTGVSFRFPTRTVDLLAALDPREAVAVEFVFAGQGRDQVRTALVEVGDFAAGQAFLKIAVR